MTRPKLLKIVNYRYNAFLIAFAVSVFLITSCSHNISRPGVKTGDGPLLGQNRKVSPAQKEAAAPPENANATDTEARFKGDETDLFEDDMKEETVAVYDPLAPFNRVMFQFNDKLYHFALKPIARAYKKVVPWEIRLSGKNFFNNLKEPIRLANCILQGKGREAVTVFGRFFINTTAGLLGLGDPAATLPNLKGGDEDLGQTLAVYGINDGPYIVLPILGPYTLRDAVGFVGDWFFHPIYYLDSLEASLGAFGFNLVNDTSYRIGDYEALKEASIDPYTAVRSIYFQHRRRVIKE